MVPNLLSKIETEDSQFSVATYSTDEDGEELHFWVRAGAALVSLESLKNLDTFISLLQEAYTEALTTQKGSCYE